MGEPACFGRVARRTVRTAAADRGLILAAAGGQTHEVSFVTARDIGPGEELCISYAALDLPYEERQRIFQYKYAFTCECPRCQRDQAATS